MKKKQLTAICMLAALGLSVSACDSKVEKTVTQEQQKEDLTQFEGSWFSNNSEFDELVFDQDGNWEMYSSGKVVYQGTMEYVEKDDSYYFYNNQDGIESACHVLEDGTLTIDTYGSFMRGVGEEQDLRPVTIADFGSYYDFWYKDGNYEETYLLLDETGLWEVYDATGMIADGTFEIDTETNNSLILNDESGESVAIVTVDDTDKMTIEVYNEELMKLPNPCVLYRESDSM